MADWHVGMRVVCVDDSRFQRSGQDAPFRKGGTYEIEAFAFKNETIICPFCKGRFTPKFDCIAIMGIDHCMRGFCRYWGAHRFRPVRETKTDISIFRKLVEPSELAKVMESVDV